MNAIVINGLSTKDFEAFSNVSVFGVLTESGLFSKLTVFKFMGFHWCFREAPFLKQSNVNARPKRISCAPFSYENGAM